MASTYRTAANTLAAWLAAADLGPTAPDLSAIARAVFRIDYDLPDLETLRVDVIFGPSETTIASRAEQQTEIALAIVVQKYAETDNQADAIVELAEAIRDRTHQADQSAAGLQWLRATLDPPLAPEPLLKHRVAFSVIRVTYRQSGTLKK